MKWINGSFLFLIKNTPPPLLTNNLFSKNIWNSIKREENMKWYLFIFDNAPPPPPAKLLF